MWYYSVVPAHKNTQHPAGQFPKYVAPVALSKSKPIPTVHDTRQYGALCIMQSRFSAIDAGYRLDAVDVPHGYTRRSMFADDEAPVAVAFAPSSWRDDND